MSQLTRCDDNHVGHFFYNYMKKLPPDAINQIDAATGEEESTKSVLSRSIRMAKCLRNLGLKPGDVLLLAGRNHLDVHIPYYAALMNGLPIAGVDPLFKYNEIKLLFKIVLPKIAFCEYTMYDAYYKVVEELALDIKIVTFGGGECSFDEFLKIYDDNQPEEEFKVATFDTENVYCWLLSTSGTTGYPKVVALRHSNVLQNGHFFIDDITSVRERKTALNLSSMQWISTCFNALLMPIDYIKVQTSAPATTEHVIDMINKYRPASIISSPSTLSSIMHHEKYCDLTCFDVIKTGGSKVHKEFLKELKARLREGVSIMQGYGQTENGGIILKPAPDGPFGNIGKPIAAYELKIVDPDTGKTVEEPNVTGELWTRGPGMACYYNDPVATAEAFSEDGFYKTGDLVYRDENDYYFFVDRMKMLLKCRNYQVVPPEVEEVILTHKDVEEVCVTGVPHPEDGERVAACVVRREGATVTAQQIKELVASQLSTPKHLRGGVVFVEALPLTSTGKIARNEVKELVISATKE